MKYVSGDIETTCLGPANFKHVLGLSLVVENTDDRGLRPLELLPNFTCIIDHGRFEGEPVALAMNAWIFEEIAKARKGKMTKYPVMTPAEAIAGALHFMWSHFGSKRATLAGKNPGSFDYQFFPPELQSCFRHRMIDAGSVHVNWDADCLPDLGELKELCGIGGPVSHDMWFDALDVIAVLRATYDK